MTVSERKSKAKRLLALIGDFVEVILKTMTRMDTSNDSLLLNNTVVGYVVDVDESFLYLGETMNGYSNLIDLDEVGKIELVENIPEELLTHISEDDSVH